MKFLGFVLLKKKGKKNFPACLTESMNIFFAPKQICEESKSNKNRFNKEKHIINIKNILWKFIPDFFHISFAQCLSKID